MKKTMQSLLRSEKIAKLLGRKVLVLAIAFFFVGLGSINAQYVSVNEASVLIKDEVAALDDQAEQTSNESELMTIKFKKDYFMLVLNGLETGSTVADAIQGNRPRAKAYVHSSGFMVYSSRVETLKQEADDLIEYTQNLLSE